MFLQTSRRLLASSTPAQQGLCCATPWNLSSFLHTGISVCSSNDSSSDLIGISAADVLEAQGKRGRVDSKIAPIYRPMSLVGPAFTVKQEAGGNLSVHHALAEAPAGCVLVVEVVGKQLDKHKRAVMGDIIAYAAKRRGILGLVTNGVVRDWDKLWELQFPVYASGLNINGPDKTGALERGGQVTIGGQTIESGDYIVGDSDGLVVVIAEEVAATAAAAKERAEAEKKVLEQIDQGATTLSVYT